MYTLRQVCETEKDKDGNYSRVVRENIYLGSSYQVFERSYCPDFKKRFNLSDEDFGEITSFIIGDHSGPIPIYFKIGINTHRSYYVITENGKIFEEL